MSRRDRTARETAEANPPSTILSAEELASALRTSMPRASVLVTIDDTSADGVTIEQVYADLESCERLHGDHADTIRALAAPRPVACELRTIDDRRPRGAHVLVARVFPPTPTPNP